MANVLGDDFVVKAEESSDPLLSIALDESRAQKSHMVTEPSTSFQSSKSPQINSEEKNFDNRKRRNAINVERRSNTPASLSCKIYKLDTDDSLKNSTKSSVKNPSGIIFFKYFL